MGLPQNDISNRILPLIRQPEPYSAEIHFEAASYLCQLDFVSIKLQCMDSSDVRRGTIQSEV